MEFERVEGKVVRLLGAHRSDSGGSYGKVAVKIPDLDADVCLLLGQNEYEQAVTALFFNLPVTFQREVPVSGQEKSV
jgi:hypothetical protein